MSKIAQLDANQYRLKYRRKLVFEKTNRGDWFYLNDAVPSKSPAKLRAYEVPGEVSCRSTVIVIFFAFERANHDPWPLPTPRPLARVANPRTRLARSQRTEATPITRPLTRFIP